MKIFFSLVVIISLSFVSLVFANPSAKVFPQIQYGYIENKGQLHNQFGELNTEVKYLLATPSLSLHLKQTGFSLEMHIGDTPMVKYHRIDISFEGANPYCIIEPDLKASDYINYYINYTRQSGVHAGKGQTNVPHYGKVTYRKVYPGIDIEFLLDKTSGQLQYKYNLIVSPGAELARVRFKVKGAQGIELNGKGNLVFKTSLGQIEESIPYSYLEANATQKQEAKVNYQLHNQETFGFSTLANNMTSKLVIDPIGWATYFGGTILFSAASNGFGVTSNNPSFIYLGGETANTALIATIGAFIGTYQLGVDCFLSKFSATGALIWGTYYGGSSTDNVYDLAIDSSSALYLCGRSYSNSGIATSGAFKSAKGGSTFTFTSGILAKFDANGFLVWGTYLGDTTNGEFEVNEVEITNDNSIYISGNVGGTTGLATLGAYRTSQQGSQDFIIFKFNSSGSRIWSTYFGGTGIEWLHSMKVMGNNQIYFAGYTQSDTGIATIGAHKTVRQLQDGFLVKFNASGNRTWGTYVGGSLTEVIRGIFIDTSGSVYLCGSSSSTSGIATTGAYLTTNSPAILRPFISKFSSLGVRQWGTYYNGNAQTSVDHIFLDVNGNVVIAGITSATTGMATANTNQTTLNGAQDVFLAKLNATGTARLWGTYFGGNQTEVVNDIYINSSDEIIITGGTNSFTGLSTLGAHQTSNLATNSGAGFPTANSNSIYLALFSPLGGLPVTWHTFEVYGQELEQELRANLLWSTASETNNDYFSIERSFNAKEFEEIAQVKGAGNSAKINHYKYVDALNLGLTKDVYYRIKQTDYDGKFAYSDIKKLTFTHALENPFQVFYQDRNVYLQSLGNWQENTQLTLVNMLGETVWETTIFAEETPVYPIPSKGAPGIYLLRVNGQSGGYTFKVVLE
jgi:hypothetical protein